MHVIIVTGFPGSGKTSLSKYLSEITNYHHYDYDAELRKVNFDIDKISPSNHEFQFFDAVHLNTQRLSLTLNWFNIKNYNIDIIYLNTDKDICRKNIKKRGRQTIDIEQLDIQYDFNSLRNQFNFGLIEIINYDIIEHNNYYGPLVAICENYLKNYEI